MDQPRLRNFANALRAMGCRTSHYVVADLLRSLNYSLQASRKTLEGTHNPDRDAPVGYINAQVRQALGAGEPAISIDTKKKKRVGDFKNAGRELRPKRQPRWFACMTSRSPNSGAPRPTGSTTSPATPDGPCRHRSRYRQLRGQCHLPLVVGDGAGSLSRRTQPADDRRLRRRQRRALTVMEARTSSARQRTRINHHRLPICCRAPASGTRPNTSCSHSSPRTRGRGLCDQARDAERSDRAHRGSPGQCAPHSQCTDGPGRGRPVPDRDGK